MEHGMPANQREAIPHPETSAKMEPPVGPRHLPNGPGLLPPGPGLIHPGNKPSSSIEEVIQTLIDAFSVMAETTRMLNVHEERVLGTCSTVPDDGACNPEPSWQIGRAQFIANNLLKLAHENRSAAEFVQQI